MSEAPIPPNDWHAFSQNRATGTNISTRILSTGVILVALAVSIIGFLHLYIRFALHRRLLDRRRAAAGLVPFRADGTANDGGDPAPSSGLEPSAIAALPAFRYRKMDEGGDRLHSECSICLSAVEEGERVRLLPSCGHLFHVGCIDMWLGSHSTCPVCRAPVEPPSSTIQVVAELREVTGTAQEGTSTASKNSEASVSMTSRFSLSFRRMLSGRERASEMRIHDSVGPAEDLERTRCELP